MKKYLIFILLAYSQLHFAQDSTYVKLDTVATTKHLRFNYKQVIIPAVLLGYGFIGLNNNGIKSLNEDIRNSLAASETNKTRIDDYLQYTPLAGTFALEAFGVKGKNDLKNKFVITATAALLETGIVMSLKSTTHQLRPDGSANNSFPSGHTATAFMGAEIMYQEYKDVSVWYGISSYVLAGTTGYLRMYNNKHWFTDVLAGAGIGILSAKAAYWLQPTICKIFKINNESKAKTVYLPFYDGRNVGIGLVSNF